MNTAMVICRATHLATCLLIFGMDAFAMLILPRNVNEQSALAWHRRRKMVLWCAIPLLVLSGLAWLVLVTIGITDPPVTNATVRFVCVRTHFGRLWQLRAVLAAAMIGMEFFGAKIWQRAILLLVSGMLLASLAWSGHGQLGTWPGVHLINDCAHLLVAGLWPIGLVPLAFVLAERSISNADAIAIAVRFSRLSVICVCMLLLSGIINSLLTLKCFNDLIDTRYGVVLIGKVVVVASMVFLGGLNRRAIRLAAPANILRRVWIEIGLSVVVVAATAWLGTLDP